MAMKPIAPKPVARAKRSKDPVARGLEFIFGNKSNANGKKKPGRSTPGVKVPGKPAPMPTMMPKYPRGVKPAPMPKVEGNYGKPRSERTLPKKMGPAGPKKKTPGVVIKPPRAKKKY